MRIVVALNRIVRYTLTGKKVLIIPHFLKEAYKHHYSTEVIEGYKCKVEKVDENSHRIVFEITPYTGGYILTRLLANKIKSLIGSQARVYLSYNGYTIQI